MDRTQEDIIIIGSSRATHHYIPKMIMDSVGLSCYNTGRDGHFLFYSYSVYEEIIKRYYPKIIVLDVTPEDIYKERKYYEGLRTLYPYYYIKPRLKHLIELKGPLEKVKLLSAVYPFNSLVISLLKDNLENNDSAARGFQPLYGANIIVNNRIHEQVINKNEIDTIKIAILKKIVTECKEWKIKLLVVNSPNYPDDSFAEAEKIVENIVESRGGVFFTYRNDPVFKANPQFFKDSIHLNKDGAAVFTKSIIGKLNEIKARVN